MTDADDWADQAAFQLSERCLELAIGGGRDAVVEALWDGDTQGWFLDIWLSTANHGRRLVTTLSYGGDIRLFTGSVPPWPEAVVARRAFAIVAQLGFESWFPSPDEPDDQCPEYALRHLAIVCVDCGKPMLPPKASSRRAGRCHRCNSVFVAQAREAEQRAALSDSGQPGAVTRVVTFAVDEVETGQNRMWGTHNTDSDFEEEQALLSSLEAVFPSALDTERDHIVGPEIVRQLAEHAKSRVGEMLADLDPVPPEREWETSPVQWGETSVQLYRIGSEHRLLKSFISLARALDVEGAGATLCLYTNRGIRLREMTLLRCVQQHGGTISPDELVRLWAEDFGSERDVTAAVDRLVELECLVVHGDVLTSTPKGRLGLRREDE